MHPGKYNYGEELKRIAMVAMTSMFISPPLTFVTQ
jgi:hypothetical protein